MRSSTISRAMSFVRRMGPSVVWVAVALSVGSAAETGQPAAKTAWSNPVNALRARLTCEKSTFVMGEPVVVTVELQCFGEKDYDFPERKLRRCQLFPHLNLRVGAAAKRIPLAVFNRLTIPKGRVVRRKIYLTDWFSVDKPGRYVVQAGHSNWLVTDYGDWTGGVLSPPLEITMRRGPGGPGSAEARAIRQRRAVRKAMFKTVFVLPEGPTALRQVIHKLRADSETWIQPNWTALGKFGLKPDREVAVEADMRRHPLRNALGTVLTKLGVNKRVGMAAGRVLYLSSQEEIDELAGDTDAAAAREMVKELSGTDVQEVARVTDALVSLGRAAVPALKEALKDPDERGRGAAMKALRQITAQPATQPARSPDSDLTEPVQSTDTVLESLNLKVRKDIQELTDAVAHPAQKYPKLPPYTTAVRVGVASEIHGAWEPYRKLASASENAEVFKAIGELIRLKAVWCLTSGLCHPSRDVQIRCVRALGDLKSTRPAGFVLAVAQANAVPAPGSKSAALHGMLQHALADTLNAILGTSVRLHKGQDSRGLKAGIAAWRAALASKRQTDCHPLIQIMRDWPVKGPPSGDQTPFFQALAALARQQGLDARPLCPGYATGGVVILRCANVERPVAIIEGVSQSRPGTSAQQVVLLDKGGKILDAVRCHINSRFGRVSADVKDRPDPDGARIVITFPPNRGHSWHEITHQGKSWLFREDQRKQDPQWDRQGLCRIAIRNRSLVVLFPRLGPEPVEEQLLPGSEMTLAKAIQDGFAFAVVCSPVGRAHVRKAAGKWEVLQRFKVERTIAGGRPGSNIIGLAYTVFDNPALRERLAEERLIWVARFAGRNYRGVKAAAYTPENRQAVRALDASPEARRADPPHETARAAIKKELGPGWKLHRRRRPDPGSRGQIMEFWAQNTRIESGPSVPEAERYAYVQLYMHPLAAKEAPGFTRNQSSLLSHVFGETDTHRAYGGALTAKGYDSWLIGPAVHRALGIRWGQSRNSLRCRLEGPPQAVVSGAKAYVTFVLQNVGDRPAPIIDVVGASDGRGFAIFRLGHANDSSLVDPPTRPTPEEARATQATIPPGKTYTRKVALHRWTVRSDGKSVTARQGRYALIGSFSLAPHGREAVFTAPVLIEITPAPDPPASGRPACFSPCTPHSAFRTHFPRPASGTQAPEHSGT